jgi:SAM-dependent methyltransferase
MQANKKEAISQWTGSAPYWEKHRDIIREMFAPVAEALIAGAQIKSGQTVLDIATGPGEPALTIAERVGHEGKVVGVDVIPAMAEAARREANRRGFRNAAFEVASADRLPFQDNTFDAVVSRFGVMFFPSPVGSIREMLRVLKPGGGSRWRCGISRKEIRSITLCRKSSNAMSIHCRPRQIRRMPSVLQSPVTCWSFFPKPGWPRHQNASYNSRYERRFRSRSFGACDLKCQTNFAPALLCFQTSGGPNLEARLSKLFVHSPSTAA